MLLFTTTVIAEIGKDQVRAVLVRDKQTLDVLKKETKKVAPKI